MLVGGCAPTRGNGARWGLRPISLGADPKIEMDMFYTSDEYDTISITTYPTGNARHEDSRTCCFVSSTLGCVFLAVLFYVYVCHLLLDDEKDASWYFFHKV